MLAVGSMLDALNDVEDVYTNNNDDYDFGEVLKLCCEEVTPDRELRCSDGTTRIFSFED